MLFKNYFYVALLMLCACKRNDRDNELQVNALAFSRVSNVLVDRETYWWHNEVSDTINLTPGILYGASVGFYHIDGADTINLSEQVLSDNKEALLFWEITDPTATIDFKGGFGASQGTLAFLQSNQAGGPYVLRLKLLYQADSLSQAGEVVLNALMPIVMK